MTVTVTWLGHNAYSLQIGEHTVVIDPFLTGNPVASTSPDAIEASFILVSHGHDDHIGDTVDIAKRTGATVVANYEVGTWIENKGVEKVHKQHVGGGFQHPFGRVQFSIALHGSSLPDGSYGGMPGGLLITANSGEKLYFACDTALFSDMQLYAGADFAALPIGDNYTMGPDDALRAVEFLKPKTVVPCHFDSFPLIKQDGAGWVARVNRGTGSKAVLLSPGESIQVG